MNGFFFQAPGVVEGVQVANPAAGADFTTTVPANQIWDLVAVAVSLNTDANAADRRMILEILDPDGNQMFSVLSSFDHVASLTYVYSFYRGAISINDASTGLEHAQMAFPNDLILGGGSTIRSDVSNIQATDQLGSIFIGRTVYLAPF